MLPNKKIAYIFVSIGDTNNNPSKKNDEKSFFKKFLDKIFKKNKKNLKTFNNFYEIADRFISTIKKYSDKKCFSFYLNLENSHVTFISDINEYQADQYYIFPIYPQYNQEINFIANFFSLHFSEETLNKIFWIKSYPKHPLFIKAHLKNIQNILKKNNLDQKQSFFLFLAKNLDTPNPLYSFECETTSQNILKAFPYIEGNLHYFSDKKNDLKISQNRKNVIIIPITSLIDTNEIIQNTNSLKNTLEKHNKNVFISKTINHNNFFVRSVFDIINDDNFISNEMLLGL